MHQVIAGATPPSAPSDPALAPDAFRELLDRCQQANTEVASISGTYTARVAARTGLAEDSKQRGVRVLAQVKSNPNWKAHLEPVARHVAKLTNRRVSAPKPPAEGETTGSEVSRRRTQGEQSHGELAQHLRNIDAALAKIPGYTVPAEDLSVAAVEDLATRYETLNQRWPPWTSGSPPSAPRGAPSTPGNPVSRPP